MKFKIIIIVAVTGALSGYFLLSPFAMYISHVVHAKTPTHMMSVFDVFKSYLILWSMSFTIFGGIIGLLIGLLYYRVTERNNRIKEAKENTELLLNRMNSTLLKVEEEKTKSEAIIACIGDGLSIVDKDFKVTYQNKVIKDIIGDHRGEYCYKSIKHNEDVCEGCPVAECFRDGEIHRVIRGITTDAGIKYFENTASPLRNSAGEIIAGIEIIRDITERKKAEMEYKIILQTAMDGFWLTDMQGRFLDVNDAYCNLIGYSRDELLKMSVLDVEAAETPEETAQHIRQIVERGGDRFETSHRCKDGRIVDIEVSSNYMDVEGGKFFVFLRDITERKRAEEALKKLQEELERRVEDRTAELSTERNKLKNILDAMNDGVYIVNQKYDIEYINPVIEKGFGPVNGRKCYEYYHDRAEVCPWCINQEVFAGRSVQWEWFSSKTGKTYDLFDTPIRNADGSVSKLEIFHDITERKKAEEALRGSEEKFRTVVDNVAIGISLISPDMEVLSLNRQMREWFPEIEIDKKPLCYRAFNNPPRQDICPYCPTKKTLQDGRVHETITETPAGDRIVNYRVVSSPIRDAEGNIIAAIEMVEDITEERENEMRLIMNERLAALGQMASGIAHEINNPLASISGCTEGLLSRLKKGQYDPQLFENYLKIMEEEIFRCKNITTNMLSFVKEKTYEQKEININEILNKSIEIIDFQGRLKRIKVINDFSDELPVIFGNEGELRQVFMTILTNALDALDAMEEKGTLTIETGIIPPLPPFNKGGITEKGGEGELVFIKISDTGTGIPLEYINRIFEPFFTTRAASGGTGLGLSIANRIVMNHNGNIAVQTEEGKGTTFKIILPI